MCAWMPSQLHSSEYSTYNNQHAYKKSNLYSLLRPFMGMEKQNPNNHVYADPFVTWRILGISKLQSSWNENAVCPRRKLPFSEWVVDHKHLSFLPSCPADGPEKKYIFWISWRRVFSLYMSLDKHAFKASSHSKPKFHRLTMNTAKT